MDRTDAWVGLEAIERLRASRGRQQQDHSPEGTEKRRRKGFAGADNVRDVRLAN
jgi:hypothetical protein